MTDPQRLLDSSGLSLTARALLEQAQVDPAGYDVAAGEARFRDSLALLSGAALGASAAKSSAGKLVLAKLGVKAALIVAGSGMLGFAIWQSASWQAPPAAAVVKRVAPVVMQAPAALAPLPARPQQPPPELLAPKRKRRARVELSAVEVEPVVEPVVARRASSAPLKPTQNAGLSLRELQSIARARSLVQRDPEAAIALLDAQRSEFPNPMFAEERDALSVIALARAGRRALAREQAAVFLRRHPNGPFSDGVRAAAAP